MVQLLWKTVWQFLRKLNIELSFDSTILILGIHSRELEKCVHAKTCTQMFVTPLFIKSKRWKIPNVQQLVNG